jgi:hypothetical protein
MLTQEEGEYAVKLARNAIEKHLSNGRVELEDRVKFNEKMGVFVTLKRNDELRGCIGHPFPTSPLGEAIVDSAISAATRDPRFKPVRKEEMKEITVEMTILTPPERVDAKARDLPKKIRIGEHGLIVKRGWSQGLLLPQVAIEHHMDEEEFLSHTCMKAGLYPDAWLEGGTEVMTFEGQIFEEVNDEIKEKRLKP